jgi:orotidine-5'-phosphate decarboxylase
MAFNPVILALDVDTTPAALALIEEFQGEVGAFKIGLELFNAAGPAIFEQARRAGAARIFYDAKLCDIPNTVAGAARVSGGRGLWLLNVHALGGVAMMRAAKEAAISGAESAGCDPPKVIAVTLLTSIDRERMNAELGLPGELETHVVRLARLAPEAGLDGVVAAPGDAPALRAACGPGFLIVTPGVRPAGADPGDQRRVMTPGEAIRAGADYLVIGRSVTRVPEPRAALRAILAEIESGAAGAAAPARGRGPNTSSASAPRSRRMPARPSKRAVAPIPSPSTPYAPPSSVIAIALSTPPPSASWSIRPRSS